MRKDWEQIQQVAREGPNPGIAGLWVQCIDHSAMLPPHSCHHKESSIFLPCYKNLGLLWLHWHLLTCAGKVLLGASFSKDLKLRSSFDTNDLSYYFQSITQISSIILLFEDNQYYSWMALKHNTRYRIISFFFYLQNSKNRAGRIQ